MSKRRTRRTTKREFEMISLIDVIFLLLIFSLIVSGGKMTGPYPGNSKTSLEMDFEFTSLGDFARHRITVTAPFTVIEDKHQRDDIEYLINAEFWRPDQVPFDSLSPSLIIDSVLHLYSQWNRESGENKEPIRLRPDDNTPFVIVDYIIRRSSAIGEEAVVLLTEKEGE